MACYMLQGRNDRSDQQLVGMCSGQGYRSPKKEQVAHVRGLDGVQLMM